MEKIDKLMEEMHDKVKKHVDKTTGETTKIAYIIFDEIRSICQSNDIPFDYDKVEKIIEENIDSNYNVMKERADFIVDCVGKEIIVQEQLKETNKYAVIDNNAFVKSENVDGKTSIDDTQRIVDQFKSDLTQIKNHIEIVAKQAGFKDEDVNYIVNSVDKKIEGLEEQGGMGDVIYSMLRTDKESLIKDTVEEYARIEKELDEIERNQKAIPEDDSKKNDFRDSLNVTKQEGFSLEEQNEFSKETIQKLEEIKEEQKENQQEDMLRGDVIE